MNGLQGFAMEILIWPIDQDPEDRMKLIEKQSLKRLKKIRTGDLTDNFQCPDYQIRKIMKDAGKKWRKAIGLLKNTSINVL
ncbi:hypothetical protein KIN20_000636 [Parelaphostrongylus tenuis]|uniref:Uncharacterized protein n=1 Tax=Parelaphostrongylus tenuis TaxID=148309 RepID=A0AAD5MBJ6_PARTN|nr:hypothetical protein KIN20_000636 [Parelaphostrongylus tenuis]